MQFAPNFRRAFASIASATLVTSMASAQTFDVKSSDVEKGKTSIEVNNSIFNGFPTNADRLRTSHEVEVSRGFTDWLKLGVKANMDKPLDDAFQFSTAGILAQATLKKFQGGIGIAWYSEVGFAVHRDETNSVTYGPILQLGTEKTHLLLNPFFSNTFGRNREQGTEFAYGWALKQEIREGLSIGVEGFGSIANIGNAPGVDFQPHRIGPVIYIERPLAGFGGHGQTRRMSVKDAGGNGNGDDKPKFGMELGVLFGLTQATQDVAVKIKAGIEF